VVLGLSGASPISVLPAGAILCSTFRGHSREEQGCGRDAGLSPAWLLSAPLNVALATRLHPKGSNADSQGPN
jgi:hypothetical protein